MDMTPFHLARMNLPDVRAMVELYPIEQIFDSANAVGGDVVVE